MSECERFVSFANPGITHSEDGIDIWEDRVRKVKNKLNYLVKCWTDLDLAKKTHTIKVTKK